MLGDGSWSRGAKKKKNKKNQKQFMHSTNTLEHTLNFLKYVGHDHVRMSILPLNKKLSHHWFGELAKIAHVPWISNTPQ